MATADRLYGEMVRLNTWTGVTHKASSFPALSSGSSDNPCWNCGKTGHTFQQCKEVKVLDEDRIERNRQAFLRNRGRGGRGGRGRGRGSGGRGGRGRGGGASANTAVACTSGPFARPSRAEKNRRVIEGVPMSWDTQKLVWKKNESPSVDEQRQAAVYAAMQAALAQGGPSLPSQGTPPPPAPAPAPLATPAPTPASASAPAAPPAGLSAAALYYYAQYQAMQNQA